MPRARVSPVCAWKPGGRPGVVSLVSTLVCVNWYADKVTMLSLPGGWYFSPASICRPLDGWNGLLS
ncbi:hypothetical protein D3C78_1656780 [compost metagenome]